jgi:hypothetical protein
MLNRVFFCVFALCLFSPTVFAEEWKHATFNVAGGGRVSVDYQLYRRTGDQRTFASPVWVNVTLPTGSDCRAKATGEFLEIRYVYDSQSSQVSRPEHVKNPGYVSLEPVSATSGCHYSGRVEDLIVRDPTQPYAAGKRQFSTLFKFQINGYPLKLASNQGPLFQLFFDESH